jgi:hypothetical protein
MFLRNSCLTYHKLAPASNLIPSATVEEGTVSDRSFPRTDSGAQAGAYPNRSFLVDPSDGHELAGQVLLDGLRGHAGDVAATAGW